MKPWLALFFLLPLLLRAEPRVLILGDSITHDGRWSTRLEAALRGTPEFERATILNLGLPSETVSGLSEDGHAGGQFPRPCLHERLGRVLAAIKPTLVLACYGMNDGIYLPPDPARMKAYQDGIRRLKAESEAAGARVVLITPPLFQADQPDHGPQHYDRTLDAQAVWLVGQRSHGWEVIDIRPTLRAAVAEARQRDTGFVFAGDGVHPGDDGHRFIAAAVADGIWPLLKLPGGPFFPDAAALGRLRERQDLLKHAWLSSTRHLRPGIPAGLALEEADRRAAGLLDAYLKSAAVRAGEWQGHERLDFTHEGRAALLVRPRQAAPGAPWIWRTEFFGHEPQADVALLARGFHVAYLDVQNLYGAPVALEAMERFHARLTADLGLSPRPVLEGFSRGGLYAFNWAARWPEKTAALYVDAPVCDFKSWPGGKGRGPGSPPDWERLLRAYGFPDEAAALAWKGNPVDQLAPLAQARIPVLAVVGDADEVVPVAENIDLVEKRYRELGGPIEVIRKPGGRHHPHSLKDPQPIVEFVLKAVSR
jgi:lysophospholipase L1-like esterase/pimeloyl-ACP methyl ester carboxylesterase